MNNLFHLTHGCIDNDIFAASIELPLAFRIYNDGTEHNTRTIKSEYILKAGSHHGFGMNALFAYRLYQELSSSGNSVERIQALRKSNLEVLTNNPHNIGSIVACMPKGCDAARIVELAFPGSQYGQFEKSDFAFFAKNVDKSLKGKPSASLLLISEIFTALQRCNRIEPDNKLSKKIIAVAEAANS